MIYENRLHPLEDKVLAIKNAPDPKTVSALQSFTGLVCYCVKFLSGLSTTMAPVLPISAMNRVGKKPVFFVINRKNPVFWFKPAFFGFYGFNGFFSVCIFL